MADNNEMMIKKITEILPLIKCGELTRTQAENFLGISTSTFGRYQKNYTAINNYTTHYVTKENIIELREHLNAIPLNNELMMKRVLKDFYFLVSAFRFRNKTYAEHFTPLLDKLALDINTEVTNNNREEFSALGKSQEYHAKLNDMEFILNQN